MTDLPGLSALYATSTQFVDRFVPSRNGDKPSFGSTLATEGRRKDVLVRLLSDLNSGGSFNALAPRFGPRSPDAMAQEAFARALIDVQTTKEIIAGGEISSPGAISVLVDTAREQGERLDELVGQALDLKE